MSKLQMDIEILSDRLNTVDTLLQRHDKAIKGQWKVINSHSTKLAKLEEIAANPTIKPATEAANQFNRLIQATRQPFNQQDKFDINQFSQQEKKILAVFFQNKDIALSYSDIAKTLGKSPNTIKNELRQITIKANLFDYTISDENRKRFKLKDNLRIENYLNIAA